MRNFFAEATRPLSVRDRIVGTLVGTAAGDALGAGYEFGPPLDLTHPVDMIGGGSFNWAPGEWTDDTSMAVAIAETVARGLDLSSRDGQDWLVARWREWAANASDIGIQTQRVFANSRNGGAAEMANAAAELHKDSGRSAGNGSLMRTAPVALAYLDDPVALTRVAREISSLTHYDPEAGDACVLWCHAIRHAVLHGTYDGLRLALEQIPIDRREIWRARIDEAEVKQPRDFDKNGWTVQALQAAWSAIYHTEIPSIQHNKGDEPRLRMGLEAAVRGGRDTDTVAAIAGGLLGARWGVSAVPTGWQRLLHGWPGLRYADLVRLAFAVTSHSTDVIDPKHEWVDFQILVPHPYDSQILLASVDSLDSLPEGVDAVVSLCRVSADHSGLSSIDPKNRVDIWLIDEPDPDYNPNLRFVLNEAANAVLALRAEGRTVVIHCAAAQSRTPTLAAVVGARIRDVSEGAALLDVNAVLPGMNPNSYLARYIGFSEQ